jgi:hypothetical protein
MSVDGLNAYGGTNANALLQTTWNSLIPAFQVWLIPNTDRISLSFVGVALLETHCFLAVMSPVFGTIVEVTSFAPRYSGAAAELGGCDEWY